MNGIKFARLLLGAALGTLLVAPLAAQGTTSAAASGSSLQLAVTFDAARNGGNVFWFQGGSVQLEGRLWRGFGAVTEVSGLHTTNMHGSGVGLDLITATIGPRLTVPLHDLFTHADSHRHVALYGESLLGFADGMDSVFPHPGASTSRATSSAVEVGGGINYALNHHIALRLIEAEWLRTALPNNATNVQNNLKLSAGVIWSMGH